MGALASIGQRDEVRERVAELAAEAKIVHGEDQQSGFVDADPDKGAFFVPTLLYCDTPLGAAAVHRVEAFGPVSTVLPYDTADE